MEILHHLSYEFLSSGCDTLLVSRDAAIRTTDAGVLLLGH
jgi:hypothetical protein